MNPLEMLKKDWKTKNYGQDYLNSTQLGMLLHKRSSNIVKWLFIIGIAEFAFWNLLRFLMPEDYWNVYESLHIQNAILAFDIINTLVLIFFLWMFYKNYRAISVFDNSLMLMKKILKTRRTIKIYVIYNLSVIALGVIAVNIFLYFDQTVLISYLEKNSGKINDPEKFIKIYFIAQLVIGVLMLLLLGLFYRLIYGILLKKLNQNYRELKKLAS
ncbi:MAG: hypothetical protein RQ735_06615 [Flavobacteriaceae bacterium]|nr:hypothetical protein [Flavobacteriaceae bacterium]